MERVDNSVWKAIEETFEALGYHLHRIKYSAHDTDALRRCIADVDLFCMRLYDELAETPARLRHRLAFDAIAVVSSLEEYVSSVVVAEDRWMRDRLMLVRMTVDDLVELLSPIVGVEPRDLIHPSSR